MNAQKVAFVATLAALATCTLLLGPPATNEAYLAAEVRWTPRAIELPGFVSHADCDEIVRLALSQGIARSTVADSEGSRVGAVRTSDGTFLDPGAHAVVSRLFDRVARLVGKPRSHMEKLQVLRYRPGQEYKAHHDACMDNCDSGRNMDRYATVVVYLNDVAAGGETEFAKQGGLRVRPRKGHAVLFFNMTRDAARVLDESLHRAEAPAAGEKWSAAVWVRQTPFQP